MKICVNVGHTLNGIGSGAIGIKNESVENRKVAKYLVHLLENLGYEVVLSQVNIAKSTDEYLKKSVDIANDSNCDLFVSIHFNSYNTKVGGVETYYYKNNDNGKSIASRICYEISKIGFKNRGAKDGSKLYVIKNTSMDALLVECCFIDNMEDMKTYDYESMAKAICNGLVGGNNLNQSSDKLYRVCIGSFRNFENAKNCLSDAMKNGYKDTFIVR